MLLRAVSPPDPELHASSSTPPRARAARRQDCGRSWEKEQQRAAADPSVRVAEQQRASREGPERRLRCAPTRPPPLAHTPRVGPEKKGGKYAQLYDPVWQLIKDKSVLVDQGSNGL